jgi:hypothetical protein
VRSVARLISLTPAAAEARLSDAGRREDLYLSSLSLYVDPRRSVGDLSGFPDQTVVERRDPV